MNKFLFLIYWNFSKTFYYINFKFNYIYNYLNYIYDKYFFKNINYLLSFIFKERLIQKKLIFVNNGNEIIKKLYIPKNLYYNDEKYIDDNFYFNDENNIYELNKKNKDFNTINLENYEFMIDTLCFNNKNYLYFYYNLKKKDFLLFLINYHYKNNYKYALQKISNIKFLSIILCIDSLDEELDITDILDNKGNSFYQVQNKILFKNFIIWLLCKYFPDKNIFLNKDIKYKIKIIDNNVNFIEINENQSITIFMDTYLITN